MFVWFGESLELLHQGFFLGRLRWSCLLEDQIRILWHLDDERPGGDSRISFVERFRNPVELFHGERSAFIDVDTLKPVAVNLHFRITNEFADANRRITGGVPLAQKADSLHKRENPQGMAHEEPSPAGLVS